MSTEDAVNPCADCGGRCCSFRLGQISFAGLSEGQRYDSFFLNHDGFDQLLLADGSVPDMRWFVTEAPDGGRNISFECEHLTDDGKCGVYDDRPGMCRGFECPALDDEDDTTVDEWVDEFARDGVPDDVDVTEVTGRVREILQRRADGTDLPDEDTSGFDGATWGGGEDDDSDEDE